MARLIINNDVVSEETFLPGQLFVFGGFALRANSISHLEQIDSYAPGHQISFRNLNYVADNRGDLIFERFAALITALALDTEQAIRSEDGSLERAGLSALMDLLSEKPRTLRRTLIPNSQGSGQARTSRWPQLRTAPRTLVSLSNPRL